MTSGEDSSAGPRQGILWLILALGVWLRIHGLSDKNLWLDESTSWDLATGSLSRLMRWTAGDIHPPLYYLVLKGWIKFAGDSLAGLRGLSVAASVLGLYLLFRLALGFVPRGIAYAVVLWLAMSPHDIYYAQEARMYALVTAVVLGACLAYRRWLAHQFNDRMAIVAYVACATAGLYLHYFAALVILALWLHMASLGLRARAPEATGAPVPAPPWGRWIAAHVAIAVLYLPWLRTAIAQIERGQSWRAAVSVLDIPSESAWLAQRLLFGHYSAPNLSDARFLIAAGVLTIGMGILLFQAVARRVDERDSFLAILALTPVTIGLALMLKTGFMDLARYLPYATAFAVLAAARGLSRSGLPAGFVAAALIIGSLTTYQSLDGYYDDPVKDTDVRPLIAYIRANALLSREAPRDSILIAPGYLVNMARYLMRDSAAYVEITDDSMLWREVRERAASPRPHWLIVDYRWPTFQALPHDKRVHALHVLDSDFNTVRLFRVDGRRFDH